MLFHFLSSPVALTKTFELRNKQIIKTPYPNAYDVSSHDENINSLQDLQRALIRHAAHNHCLLKGALNRPLVSESRAGSTDSNAATSWVCLDVDGLPVSAYANVDVLLAELGLGDVSYVLQWSASYMIESNDLRCHIFMMLDKPMAAPLIKQWLYHLNLSTRLLSFTELSKSGNALKWPLDVTACQNDKLLYIAPPTLKKLKDPVPGNRISLQPRKQLTLKITGTIPSTSINKERINKRINELRELMGAPKRKFTYKHIGSQEVLTKPDTASITEIKYERGYVYFNLNGGDSWAYYHPENNPDYIFNFKGEPVYLTKELLPDYWAELTAKPITTMSSGLTYLAVTDRKTGDYCKIIYDNAADLLEINRTRSALQLRDFAKQHGVPLGENILEWAIEFDPHNVTTRIDPANKRINLFQPTQYMQAKPRKQSSIPPTINKVLSHALGGQAEVIEHFINWLAFILQFRDLTKTAWVLHGTQGTGKGILMNHVLRPLFGENQTAIKRMEEFAEKYNDFMQHKFIVFVDEVQTSTLNNERGTIAKLKSFITETHISGRAMYRTDMQLRNYTNWIFASNMADTVRIDKEDRRFNVANYQPDRLNITPQEIDRLSKELQAFHDYLALYPVDQHKAMTPLDTEDRDNLISISEEALDTVADALLKGNMEFFIDQLPTTNTYQSNMLEFNKVEDYKHTLLNIIQRTKSDGSVSISRDELRPLFEYTVGNMPASPNKFTSRLKHHRIHVSKVWINERSVNGLKTVFGDVDKFAHYQLQLTGAPPKLKAVK